MVCPHCAAVISSSDYSCPTCKTDLRPPPPMNTDLGAVGWKWSPLIGITYNRIPVGLIVGGAVMLIFAVVYLGGR